MKASSAATRHYGCCTACRRRSRQRSTLPPPTASRVRPSSSGPTICSKACGCGGRFRSVVFVVIRNRPPHPHAFEHIVGPEELGLTLDAVGGGSVDLCRLLRLHAVQQP